MKTARVLISRTVKNDETGSSFSGVLFDRQDAFCCVQSCFHSDGQSQVMFSVAATKAIDCWFSGQTNAIPKHLPKA